MTLPAAPLRTLIAAALLAGAATACGGETETLAGPVGVEDKPGSPTASSPLDALIPWPGEAGDTVRSTDSGLQYVVVSIGEEEGVSPGPRDTVTVMYEGRLAETGTTFDSSYARGAPATFPLTGVIKGWQEGLQLMSEGDEFVFYIPSELGYGASGSRSGSIGPDQDLVFRVELQDVTRAPEPRPVDEDAWDTYTPWDSSREGVIATGSGLEYVILESGPEDGASPTPGQYVAAYYEGRLDSDGTVFDSAFQRGEAAVFPAGRLIPGWVEVLQLMKPGDRWLVHVPADLAYGEAGTPDGVIPPDAALNFELELMRVMDSR